MATEKGLANAIEFTKHIMTLSGAGIAFIAALDTTRLEFYPRAMLLISLALLGVSLAAGLFVWSRASVMMSKRKFSLEDFYLRLPGLINIFAFGLGVLSLAAFVVVKMFTAGPAPASKATSNLDPVVISLTLFVSSMASEAVAAKSLAL